MKFAGIIIYFLIWVAITTGIFYLLIALDWSRFFVLIPALGGLALWFYLGYKAEQKPPTGPTALLLLLTVGGAASCSRATQSTTDTSWERRAAVGSDSAWATTTTRQSNGFDATEKAWK